MDVLHHYILGIHLISSMKVVPMLGMYVASERTPGIGGGVMASARTPVEAITRCLIRKAAAYKGAYVLFDCPDPVRELRVSCQCCTESGESLNHVKQLLLPAPKFA
jgi:hypothetical protein